MLQYYHNSVGIAQLQRLNAAVLVYWLYQYGDPQDAMGDCIVDGGRLLRWWCKIASGRRPGALSTVGVAVLLWCGFRLGHGFGPFLRGLCLPDAVGGLGALTFLLRARARQSG